MVCSLCSRRIPLRSREAWLRWLVTLYWSDRGKE